MANLEWRDISKLTKNDDLSCHPIRMKGEWLEQTDFVNGTWVLFQVNKDHGMYHLYKLEGINSKDLENPYPIEYHVTILGMFKTLENAKAHAALYFVPK